MASKTCEILPVRVLNAMASAADESAALPVETVVEMGVSGDPSPALSLSRGRSTSTFQADLVPLTLDGGLAFRWAP